VTELELATSIIEKYGDQKFGLADASIVVLADRYRIRTIATLDQRHFDALRPIGGGRFSIHP
jgi:predicted nucleic acid-binding protein